MTQNEKILKHLMNNGPLTRVTAMFHLRIMNLTARITELRDKGIDIKMRMVEGADGSKYGEYYLDNWAKRSLILRRKVDWRGGEYVPTL
jgi:hypothetical protein